MKRLIAAAALLAASAAYADKFSAADVPSAHLRQPGRVVIRNSGATITAYQFFGNIREALFSIRTTPVSKSSSGTPSRQPVGHSSMHTRQPLQ